MIGAYGSGAKPVISGLSTLSGWSSMGSALPGVYQSACPSCLAKVNMVLVDGVNTAMGRWPNSSASNKGYRTITSHSGNTSITDGTLASASAVNWADTGMAEAVIRKNHWVLDRAVITGQSGGTLSFTAAAPDEPIDGFGYFIQNHPKTLDLPGEWYFKPKDSQTPESFQMYFGGSAPSSSVVQVSTVDTLVRLLYRQYLVFDNLVFRGANSEAFYIGSSSNIVIQNVDIDDTGKNAINGGDNWGQPSSGFLVQNSTINHTNNNGIMLTDEFAGAKILSNLIQNTGLQAGMGKNSDHKAITTYHADNLLIQNNVILNTGYTAVSFTGNNVVVQNNAISTFCTVADDGGGIYTWNGVGAQYAFTGDKVLGNVVTYGIGAPEGTKDGQADAQGIYMDDNTANVEIAGNTSAYNAVSGIFLHLSHDLNVHDNAAFGNHDAQLMVSSESTLFPVRNVVVKNNTFVSNAATQWAAYFDSRVDDIASFGTLDYNLYARPIDDNQTIDTVLYGYTSSTSRTLASWQTYVSPQDAHSSRSPYTVANASDVRFEFNATGSPMTIPLDATYSGMDGRSYAGSVQLAPYTSIVLIKN